MGLGFGLRLGLGLVRQLGADLRGKGLECRLELLHLPIDEPREMVLLELLVRLALLLGASRAQRTLSDAELLLLGQPQPATLRPLVDPVVLAVAVGLPPVAAEPG